MRAATRLVCAGQSGQVTLNPSARGQRGTGPAPVFRMRGDALVAGRVDRQRPGTGLFQGGSRLSADETQQSQNKRGKPCSG